MAILPIGSLVSFGSSDNTGSPAGTGNRLNFNTNVAANISVGPQSTPPTFTRQSLEQFQAVPNASYPLALYGQSNAPLKDPVLSAKYLLLTAAGLSDSAAYTALQTQINTLYSWFTSTYTYNGNAGVGGQYGDLVITDGGGTNRTCQAKWTAIAIPLTGGDNTMFAWAELTWTLLTDFS